MFKSLLTTYIMTKILSPPPIEYRGGRTRRWQQILDQKQNSRYLCTWALKKLPNHWENVYR